jgi:hypothetical protein
VGEDVRGARRALGVSFHLSAVCFVWFLSAGLASVCLDQFFISKIFYI